MTNTIPTAPHDRLLKIGEVAELTGHSPRTLYSHATRRHLPQPTRVANRLRWSERAVLAWIAERVAEGEAA